MVTIWVDADACPGAIRDILLRAADRRVLPITFVANKSLFLPTSDRVRLVTVGKGSDIADQYIADTAQPGDLVVTQDIPLAAILVPKGIAVISVHGELFTPDSIGERLSLRNFMHDLRGAGEQTSGPRPFNDRDKKRFADSLDRELTRLLR